MLKIKNAEKKKGSPSKAIKGEVVKTDEVAKKVKKAKQIKGKDTAKLVKKVVKDGLVKAPAPASKIGASPVKKVPDEKVLEAKKEKRKQKKLEKKLKKAEAKKAVPSENGKDKVEVKASATSESKKSTKKPQQNGAEAEVTEGAIGAAIKSPEKTKNKKKKQKQISEPKEKSTGPPGTPGQTVFVGNLPTNTKRIQLVKLFTPYAPILGIRFRTASGKVIFKHKMRKESGAINAYIVLKDEETAAKALQLNGCEFKGNHLRVTKTDKPEEEVDSKRMVFVGNLKYSATDDKLRQIFSSCGDIEYVRTLHDPDKNGCKGVAFVCFKNPDSVGLALELKGTVLDERPINVERYSVKKLGAKVKRDSEGEKTKGKAPQKGQKFGKKDGGAKKNTTTAGADDEKKKKSEFRGVKSDVIKKKQKKKVPSEMKKMAKKIAPKSDE